MLLAKPSSGPAAPLSVGASPAEGPRRALKWSAFPLLLVQVLIAVLLFRTFVAAPFTIPSGSMQPTLEEGDFLLAAKWPYGWSRHSVPFGLPLVNGHLAPALPERGDVVIFRHPLSGADYIKRVVGLPGDTVELRDGVLHLNGMTVERERLAGVIGFASGDDGCQVIGYRETLPNGSSYAVLDFGSTAQDQFGPVTVPPGKLFVLGDNRDQSADSRFPADEGGAGLVRQGQLVGRAWLVVSPSRWEWFSLSSDRASAQ